MSGDLLLELYKLERARVQSELSLILIIRGWAITLTAGLITAMALSHDRWIAFGGTLLVAFGYQESVYQRFLDEFMRTTERLAALLPVDRSILPLLSPQVKYRRFGPYFVAYFVMAFAIVMIALLMP